MRLDFFHANGICFTFTSAVFIPLFAVLLCSHTHDAFKRGDDSVFFDFLRRSYYISIFRATRRFNDNAVALLDLKCSGIKIIHLPSIFKFYTNYGFHWFDIASDNSKKSLSITARSVRRLAPGA